MVLLSDGEMRCGMGEPFQVMAAGCGGCWRAPMVAGLRFSERDRTAWFGFACDRQAAQLIAPCALLPRDRDVLNRRRDREATELSGRRWAGEREGPLARGRDAVTLVERARTWAAAHPYPETARGPG